MGLHLQNVSTGDVFALPRERALIGTADHAEVRTAAGGPYLAAVAARYDDWWTVYGLSDEGVLFNRRVLRPGEGVCPKGGDLLAVGAERFTFRTPGRATAPDPPDGVPPACFAFITNPDGMEECRAVDHDLLFGRLPFCHVQLADSRLSRLSALLAAHGGGWFLHVLSKKPVGRNRKAVHTTCPVADGDELQIGPLWVRIELREAAARPADPPLVRSGSHERLPLGASAVSTDLPDLTETPAPGGSVNDLLTLQSSGKDLDNWLKGQNPPPAPPKSGLGGWLGAQRDKLRRFWLDTPETTAARSLRTAGRLNEAFTILDRAIRARSDSPELLRELYRLYEGAGLLDLCYRPLRHIEKLALARSVPDPWVLEALARHCERMGHDGAEWFDRAVAYWNKLEAATNTSYARQKADVMALRALRDGGYASTADQ